jgi:putative ABC transport system substrate-binding protein
VKRLLSAAGFLLCCIASFACAQAPLTPARIGIVEFGAPADSVFTRAYLAGLKQLGYAEPGTLRIERRYAQGDASRFPGLLQELAAQRVDLVFTVGNDIALVARQATPSLVVVTAGSDDPQMSGLIGDYRRPGGNITGVTYLSPQLAAKRLELLKDAVPGMVKVAVLWDPTHADTYYKDMVPAARQLGVSLQLFQVHSPGEIGEALAAAQRAGAQALFVVPSRMLNLQSRRIAELALGAKLPVMAAYANFAEAGCLMSYGAVASDMLRRAAVQTDKILKGAKAGDLPFEQATTFELIVNLKTAKAIGLKLPQSILVRADRVVE